MKIRVIEPARVVMDNPGNQHCYFGWPTAIRLKNGRIALAASGFRLSHICPFGKAVLSFSEDEGKTYTRPAAIIDTVLDDRDAGLCTFGESGLILTSFNNTCDFQRRMIKGHVDARSEAVQKYVAAYLDTVTEEQQEAVLGATYRISYDNGVTFGPLYVSPVTNPHGPIELNDGSILWVGSAFRRDNQDARDIHAYRVNMDGTMDKLGEIPPIVEEDAVRKVCEPYTIQLADGTLICHIRVEPTFTTFQSVSTDGGRSWSEPEKLLPDRGGAPMHLLQHSSGALIAAYSYREEPYGLRAMFSYDGGKTWDKDHIIYKNDASNDLGYPSMVELADGSLLTVFYARERVEEPSVIMQTVWTFER